MSDQKADTLHLKPEEKEFINKQLEQLQKEVADEVAIQLPDKIILFRLNN